MPSEVWPAGVVGGRYCHRRSHLGSRSRSQNVSLDDLVGLDLFAVQCYSTCSESFEVLVRSLQVE